MELSGWAVYGKVGKQAETGRLGLGKYNELSKKVPLRVCAKLRSSCLRLCDPRKDYRKGRLDYYYTLWDRMGHQILSRGSCAATKPPETGEGLTFDDQFCLANPGKRGTSKQTSRWEIKGGEYFSKDAIKKKGGSYRSLKVRISTGIREAFSLGGIWDSTSYLGGWSLINAFSLVFSRDPRDRADEKGRKWEVAAVSHNPVGQKDGLSQKRERSLALRPFFYMRKRAGKEMGSVNVALLGTGARCCLVQSRILEFIWEKGLSVLLEEMGALDAQVRKTELRFILRDLRIKIDVCLVWRGRLC